MSTFTALWALISQFIVHSSRDFLKPLTRQKPSLFVELAVVCMQIDIGGKKVLENTL